jgi:hypothetical protein
LFAQKQALIKHKGATGKVFSSQGFLTKIKKYMLNYGEQDLKITGISRYSIEWYPIIVKSYAS